MVKKLTNLNEKFEIYVNYIHSYDHPTTLFNIDYLSADKYGVNLP